MPASAILGHVSQLAALSEDLAQGNVSHAYLFSGSRHLGKFTVAKWFARSLLTAGLSGDEKENALNQIERLLYPDLLVLDRLWIEETCEDFAVIAQSSNVPQQHRMKAKAKTDTIGIDDVRSLQERLHEVRIGTHRCCLIRSVERMQTEAVNALLKILEEPPPGVVFLLTTESLPSLLPTLTSRARTMHFSRLTDGELDPLLESTSDDERQFLLRVAQGAPGVIRRLRDDPELLRRERQAYASALSFWHSRSPAERVKLLAPIHERGAEADQFLLHLHLAFREEHDELDHAAVRHLMQLSRNLETNVNRQMVAQNFVLALLPG